MLERVRPFLSVPVETLRQTDDGTVLIGDSQQDVGFDETLDTGVLAAMAQRAVRSVPGACATCASPARGRRCA